MSANKNMRIIERYIPFNLAHPETGAQKEDQREQDKRLHLLVTEQVQPGSDLAL
jgi:hypothetical protein